MQTVLLSDLVAQGVQPERGDNQVVVLVVDDEPAVADTIVDILQKSGFFAMATYRADTALEFASVIPPDLMISDILLPGMNGIELATIMKKKCPNCRVLLLTADPEAEEMLEQARKEGNNFPVLMKPMYPGELLFALADPDGTSWRNKHSN